MFERIKKWFEQGLWTDTMIDNAVKKGVLSEEQAEEIKGGAA